MATEHRFSYLVDAFLEDLERTHAPGFPERPLDLLLLPAYGNEHTFGLRIAGIYLATAGVSTLALPQGRPTAAVLALLDQHNPAAVGFSIALPAQFRQVREVVAALRRRQDRPWTVLAGGYAIRTGFPRRKYAGIQACRSLREVHSLLAAAGRDAAPPRQAPG